jgi:hypothetical protein
MRRVLSTLVIVGLASAGQPATLAAPKAPKTLRQTIKAFPDGAWTGTAHLRGGISKDGFRTRGEGKLTFTVVIQKGAVTAGDIHYDLVQHSSIEASDATGIVTYRGTLEIGGTASKLFAGGSLEFVVTGHVGGVPIPETRGPIEARVSFSPTVATCTRVSGDIGIKPSQQAAGFASDVRAPFVAIRVPDLEKDFPPEIAADHSRLDGELIAALKGEPDPDELLRLVREAGELVSQIIGAAACGGPPPNFKKGVAGTLFLDLFYELLVKVAGELPDRYDARALIAMLGVAVRAGVVGSASPNPKEAGALKSLFEDALADKLKAAIAEGDHGTILEIAVAAQQAGMTSLAGRARAAL